MKLSAKRESTLERVYQLDRLRYHDVTDKRSLKWLDDNGFVEICFNMRTCETLVKITNKGVDYLKQCY